MHALIEFGTVLAHRTGKVIHSSWSRGEVAPLALDGVIPGLAKGLEGKKADSRVLLVVPPDDGYGAQGVEKRGIRATDTLVFLVDILGVH
jgi:peptidylprolyl isomerase